MSNNLTKIEQNHLMETLFNDYLNLMRIGITPGKAKLLLAKKHGYSQPGIWKLIRSISNQKIEQFLQTPDTQKAILVPQGIKLEEIYQVLTN